MSTFYTIESPVEGLYKEKGSKFLAFAYPVISEQQVKDLQDELRKKYYDARHHCFAWVIGLEDQSWRANDDGEPAHSAGDPILGQIKPNDLTNVLVVVIRYFGGTKLGVGGLINAYKTATEAALNKSTKKAIYETKRLVIRFTYDDMSVVERLMTDFEIEVIKRDYQLECILEASIKKDIISSFREKITDLYTIKFEFEE